MDQFTSLLFISTFHKIFNFFTNYQKSSKCFANNNIPLEMSQVLHKPSVSRAKLLFRQAKTAIYLIFTLAVMGIFIPACALVSYGFWLVALLVSNCDPNLGRFATSLDAWMDEDFTNNLPRSSIVTTVVLEGHLSLEQLKTLIHTNVLQATFSNDHTKIRYPELQQYLTRFMGFRIWKKVSNFNIDNHVAQRFDQGPLNLEMIHQELVNKPYQKEQSPWEILLINFVNNDGKVHSVVAARLHHAMADGRSILKLMVECLGQKRLKTAQAVKQYPSFLSVLKFYLLFPLQYFYVSFYVFYKFCTSHAHPWKMHGFRDDKYSRINVAFSPQLKLTELKKIAKKNNVTSSSVVMSLVAGAIRKCGVDFEDRDVIMGYPLPKDNHPENMANHVYMGIIPLPTDQNSAIKRLHKCNEIFVDAKTTQLGKYTSVFAQQSGTLIYPLVKHLAVNYFVPLFLTNIAGDEEGFSVGELPCADFRMTVGTLEGVASVIFCAFSYKDGIVIGITAKENALSNTQTEKLASDIEAEMKLLATV